MAKYIDGNVVFPTTMKVEKTAPLDDRLVVESFEDLTNETIDYIYEGMVVNIVGKEDLYVLVGLPATDPENWKRIKGAEEIDHDNGEIYSYIDGVQSNLEKRITDEVGLLLDNPDEAINSIKEIVTWCNDHLRNFEQFKDLVDQGLQSAFVAIKDRVDGLQTALEDADKEIKEDVTGKLTDINTEIEDIKGEIKKLDTSFNETIEGELLEIWDRLEAEHQEHDKTEAKLDKRIRTLYEKIEQDKTDINTEKNEILKQLAAEKLARETSDQNLQLQIDNIKDNCDNGSQGVQEALEVEINNRIKGEQAILADLAKEKADRIEGDQSVQSDLAKEKADRIEGDKTLNDALTQEIKDRIAGDKDVQSTLEQEVKDRIEGDKNLQKTIDEKERASKDRDENLFNLINKREVESKERDEKIKRDVNDKLTALEGSLQKQITDNITDFKGVQTILQNELNRVENQSQIRDNDILSKLELEAKIRKEGDDQLRTDLENEVANRLAEHELIREDIEDEAKTRLDQDAILAQAIVDEELRSEKAEGVLQNNIDNEEQKRKDADDDLRKDIDDSKKYLLGKINDLKKLIFGEGDIALTFDTIKEIADWIIEHNADYTELVKYVEELKNGEAKARQQDIEDVKKLIQDEVDARVAADNTLQTNIDTEASDRKTADDALKGDITAEANARETADNALDSKITAEVNERDTADKALSEFINRVKNASKTKDLEIEATLQGLEQTLTTTAKNLQSQIETEIENRENADDALDGRIDDEVTARTNADDALDSKIDSKYDELLTLLDNLKNDLLGVTGEDDDIEQILESILDIPLFIKQHKIEYENLKTIFENFNNSSSESIGQLLADLAQEKTDRENADNTLSGNIKGVRDDLDQEILDRDAADTTLQGNIDAEKTARETADNTLSGKIKDVSDALEQEVSDRETADTTLQGNIDAEKTARETAENAINTRITEFKEEYDEFKEEYELTIEELKKYTPEIVGDDWVTSEIGDIPSGLHKDDELISGKSINYIIDKLLYKTLQPEVTEPSISLSYKGNDEDGEVNLIEVGSNLPADFDFIKSYDRGTVTLENANGDNYYTGDATESLTISRGEFVGVATEGIYTVKYSVDFAEGATLKDNKGNDATVAKYPGGVMEKTKVFHSCLKLYANTVVIDDVDGQETVDYIAGDAELIVVIPNETTANKFELHVPSHLKFACHQYLPLGGGYSDMMELVNVGTTTHDDVEYTKYVRTTNEYSMQSSSKYKIIISQSDGIGGNEEFPPVVEPEGPEEPDTPEGPIKLDAPEVTYEVKTYNSILVSWNPVEHADYYEYETSTGQSDTTEETEVLVTNLTSNTQFTCKVTSCSNNPEMFEKSEEANVEDTFTIDWDELLKPTSVDVEWLYNNPLILPKPNSFRVIPKFDTPELPNRVRIKYYINCAKTDTLGDNFSFNLDDSFFTTNGYVMQYSCDIFEVGDTYTLECRWEVFVDENQQLYPYVGGQTTYDLIVGTDGIFK